MSKRNEDLLEENAYLKEHIKSLQNEISELNLYYKKISEDVFLPIFYKDSIKMELMKKKMKKRPHHAMKGVLFY